MKTQPSLVVAALIAASIGFFPPVIAAQTAPVETESEAQSAFDPVEASVARGVAIILERQEGPDRAEWPYEGVYRVGGRIPIGYRVGGTSICATALLRAPGYDDDRRAAVVRAIEFVCASIEHPLMSIDDYQGGYDVRGWGYVYALSFLLELERGKQVPETKAEAVETAIAFYLDALERIEIPESGGWNYARRGGSDEPAPAAPFMTGPALQALFAAKRQGYPVDPDVVRRGLDALEASRGAVGAFVYSGDAGERRSGVPGAVGRMVVGESTLHLAGRADVDRVRGAIDAFLVHWKWLDARRAKTGTHVPPYGVAPYYFYFAHAYAAQAIELLPEAEREEYRVRLRELLFGVQLDDGSWNDRVFDRSTNFGTAMSMWALSMPDAPAPAAWTKD